MYLWNVNVVTQYINALMLLIVDLLMKKMRLKNAIDEDAIDEKLIEKLKNWLMKNAIDKKYDWWKMRLMKKMQKFNTTVLMPYMCIDTTRIILMQLDNNKNVLKQCKCFGRNTICIESLQMLFFVLAVYRNSACSQMYLSTSSPGSIRPFIAKIGDLYTIFGHLKDGIREGVA